MDFADRYIAKFHEEFQPDEKYKLHKTYFDIEVDLMPYGWKKDSKGNIGYTGFPDEEIAPCPINIISLFDEKSMVLFSFVVRNKLNASLKEFEDNVDSFKTEMLSELLQEDFISLNDIRIMFFDDELEAIERFFDTIHEIDPDFTLAWNMCFDVMTMQNRLKKLYARRTDLKEKNLKPYDLMISKASDQKYIVQKDSSGSVAYIPPRAYYSARKDQSFVDRTDYFDVVDGINWMDQLLYYANIRKTGGQKESYSLDAIVNDELDKEKLEFSGSETIKTLPWTNFKKFAKYNIRDVILLALLEEKNLDMDMLQRLSEITNTRKEKVFRKTVSLKNFVSKYAVENGFVMGTNKNSKYGEDWQYYEKNYLNSSEYIEHNPKYKELLERQDNFGAFVADPNQNLPDNGIILNGRRSNFLFEKVFDMDFSALYPSIIRAYNLDKNTQIGKFFLVDKEIKEKLIMNFGYENLFVQSKNIEAEEGAEANTDDLAPLLVDSIISSDYSRLGEKFFNLPSTKELIEKIEKLKE